MTKGEGRAKLPLVDSPSNPALVGIARLALNGNLLQAKRRVEYRSLPTRKWLNRCLSQRVPFHWTINPYRGCEYGCKYCYARFTHEFLERQSPEAFETEIFAKDFDPGSFRRELFRVRTGECIGIGTATDPYQPAERKFERTRSLLQALIGVRGLSVYITTKSDLITRDTELLKELATQNALRISMTVTTTEAELARLLEPYAPRPSLRFNAVAELASNRISVGVLASPVLPLLTDSRPNLLGVAKWAKRAGADSFSAGVLFLQPSAQRVFFPFLGEHFPADYLDRYRKNYLSGAYLRGPYPDMIRRRIDKIRVELGLHSRDLAFLVPAALPGGQMRLF